MDDYAEDFSTFTALATITSDYAPCWRSRQRKQAEGAQTGIAGTESGSGHRPTVQARGPVEPESGEAAAAGPGNHKKPEWNNADNDRHQPASTNRATCVRAAPAQAAAESCR